MAKTKSISVRVDEDVLKMFDVIAHELSVNRSRYIENSLKHFIKKNEHVLNSKKSNQ
jgi:predicted transcriptional regulator